MSHNYTTQDVERFWSHVDKSGGDDACWIWTASKTDGYGRISWNGRMTLAHRLSFEFSYGEISDDICVLHNCPTGDNPACVNPHHLWLGTNADNVEDRVRKHRSAILKREANGMHKLTVQQVQEIKAFSLQGMNDMEIAKIFNVHRCTIGKILNEGRHTRRLLGDDNARLILSSSQVREIRRLRAEQGISWSKLGKMFGVSKSTICDILSGKSWKHLV